MFLQPEAVMHMTRFIHELLFFFKLIMVAKDSNEPIENMHLCVKLRFFYLVGLKPLTDHSGFRLYIFPAHLSIDMVFDSVKLAFR